MFIGISGFSLVPKLDERLYLEHEQDGVHENEQHDEVFEGPGRDEPPDVVPDASRLWRDVELERLGLDGEVDAGFLK